MTVDRLDRDEPMRTRLHLCKECGGLAIKNVAVDGTHYCDAPCRYPAPLAKLEVVQVVESRPSPGPAGSTTGDYAEDVLRSLLIEAWSFPDPPHPADGEMADSELDAERERYEAAWAALDDRIQAALNTPHPSVYAGLLSEENVEAGARALLIASAGAVRAAEFSDSELRMLSEWGRAEAVLEAVANRVSE